MSVKVRLLVLLAFSMWLVYSGVVAIRDGRYSGRYGVQLNRSENPIGFWFGMFVIFGASILFVILAFNVQVRR